jgi:hypothetical protein
VALEIAFTEAYLASVYTVPGLPPRRRIVSIVDTETHVRVTFGLDWGTAMQLEPAIQALRAEREEAEVGT